MSLAISDRQEFAGRAKISGDTSNMHERTGDCDASGAGEKDDASVAAAKAIMTKLAKSGGSVAAVRSRRGGGGGISASDGDDVESLQEKVLGVLEKSPLTCHGVSDRNETCRNKKLPPVYPRNICMSTLIGCENLKWQCKLASLLTTRILRYLYRVELPLIAWFIRARRSSRTFTKKLQTIVV